MTHLIGFLLFILLSLAGLVMAVIAVTDSLLASAMSAFGLPPGFQMIVLIVIAVGLILLAIRALGPILATLVALLLILLVLHQAFPAIHPPAPPPHGATQVQNYI